MANMVGSEVCILSFTIIPPRTPISKLQVLANSSLGLIPAEITSMSTSKVSSSPNSIPVMALSPSMQLVALPVCMVIPIDSKVSCNTLLLLESNCLGINFGANSTTCGSKPISITAFPASRPKSPPPNTAAFPLGFVSFILSA